MMLASWLFCSMYAILAYTFHLTHVLDCLKGIIQPFPATGIDYSHLSVVHSMQGFFFSWWSLLIFLLIIGFLLTVDSTKQVITSGCFPDILCFVFFALNGGSGLVLFHYMAPTQFASASANFDPFPLQNYTIRYLVSGTIFRATLLKVPSELRYILSHPVYIIIAMWGLTLLFACTFYTLLEWVASAGIKSSWFAWTSFGCLPVNNQMY